MPVAEAPDRACAFFDVDDTLITGFAMASMFTWLTEQDLDRDLSAKVEHFQDRVHEFPDRATLLAGFFALLQHQSYSRLLLLGERWFADIGHDLMKPEVVARTAHHRQRGDHVVLVSGSWLPCLLPLGREVGATAILGCELEVDDRELLTGVATRIMIGDTKAAAISSFTRERRIDLGRCFAYGADPSDIPMLQTVGHPIVVGDHPELNEIGAEAGWETLHTSVSTP